MNKKLGVVSFHLIDGRIITIGSQNITELSEDRIKIIVDQYHIAPKNIDAVILSFVYGNGSNILLSCKCDSVNEFKPGRFEYYLIPPNKRESTLPNGKVFSYSAPCVKKYLNISKSKNDNPFATVNIKKGEAECNEQSK